MLDPRVYSRKFPLQPYMSMQRVNASSYLTLSFTHEFFEPLKHFEMPFERILGIENPMTLIREVEEPTGNPTPIVEGQLMCL